MDNNFNGINNDEQARQNTGDVTRKQEDFLQAVQASHAEIQNQVHSQMQGGSAGLQSQMQGNSAGLQSQMQGGSAEIQGQVQGNSAVPVYPNSQLPGFAEDSEIVRNDSVGGFGDYAVSASGESAKKSALPFLVLGAVLALLTAAIAGVTWFFLNNGSSYERAERNAFSALSSELGSLSDRVVANSSTDIKLSVMPASGLFDTLGSFGMGGLDIDALTLEIEAIVENGDYFNKLAAGLSNSSADVSLSFLIWQLGEQIIMQLPELSEYYITIDGVDDLMGNMGGMSAMSSVASNPYAMFDKIDQKQLQKTLDRIADKYFELTADAPKVEGVTVTAGDLSKTADMYIVDFTEILLMELVREGLLAVLDNANIMSVIDEYLQEYYDSMDEMHKDALENYGEWYSDWYLVEKKTAAEQIRELIAEVDESFANEDFDDEVSFTMEVYVSGKDVVKRVINFDDEIKFSYANLRSGRNYACEVEAVVFGYSETVTFNYTDTGVKGSSHARSAELRSEPLHSGGSDFVITYSDTGETARNGAVSGDIKVIISDNSFTNYTANLKYSDIIFTDSGLFGGSAELNIANIGLVAIINSTISGNTQTTEGSLSVLGIDMVSFELVVNVNTGKAIDRPALNSANSIGVTDYEDIIRLGEIFGEAGAALEAMFDSLGFGGLGGMSPFSGGTDWDYEDEWDWDFEDEWTVEDWDSEYDFDTRHFGNAYEDFLNSSWANIGFENMTDEDWRDFFAAMYGDWLDYEGNFEDLLSELYAQLEYYKDLYETWANVDIENMTTEELAQFIAEMYGELADFDYYNSDDWDYDDWNNFDYEAASLAIFKGLWQVVIGDDWSEFAWAEMIAEYDVSWFDAEDWLSAWAEYGFDVAEVFYAIEAALDDYYYQDLFDVAFDDWQNTDWQEFWRGVFEWAGVSV
ncbi:MAG: hypothetical protein FWH20_04505 [Oscillospiraceae bacterium]|nr:hypothetical protein [Oscillospiraceae bacterium]